MKSEIIHCISTDLLVEFNILQDLDGLIIISKERMKAQETDETEIPQHLVEGVPPKLPRHCVGISPLGVGLQLLIDVALLNQGVEDIEHRMNIPEIPVLCQLF